MKPARPSLTFFARIGKTRTLPLGLILYVALLLPDYFGSGVLRLLSSLSWMLSPFSALQIDYSIKTSDQIKQLNGLYAFSQPKLTLN